MITTTNALADFVPFDAASAKDAFHNSSDETARGAIATDLYHFYLQKGSTGYGIASSWFMHALANKSPDALLLVYAATSDVSDARTAIDPLLRQRLNEINYPSDQQSRVRYLALATAKKQPNACQLSSIAITQMGTPKENTSLLKALEENGIEISRAQSLELQAIALAKGDRILTNNYAQLIRKNDPDNVNDQERLTMLKTMGLEISTLLSADFRVLSALGNGREASHICFNALVMDNYEIATAFERIGMKPDKRMQCSLGNNLRHDRRRYEDVLEHFTLQEIVQNRYSPQEMHHIQHHAIGIFQQTIHPGIRNDLLAPNIFHHKVA